MYVYNMKRPRDVGKKISRVRFIFLQNFVIVNRPGNKSIKYFLLFTSISKKKRKPFKKSCYLYFGWLHGVSVYTIDTVGTLLKFLHTFERHVFIFSAGGRHFENSK